MAVDTFNWLLAFFASPVVPNVEELPPVDVVVTDADVATSNLDGDAMVRSPPPRLT